MKRNKTVAVGLSGGIDSSVAVHLLKKEGFSVIGVFMRFWAETGENRCCSSEGEERARKVASLLDIPFYVVNLEEDFKRKIVDSFLSDLKKGETPNPCALCNREIKFRVLIEKLAAYKADYVATGHYAKLLSPNLSFDRTGCLSAPAAGSSLDSRSADSLAARPSSAELRNVLSKESLGKKETVIYKAKDKQKDQSYFLWNLKKEWLKKIVFPLGEYKKEEVRKIAKKLKLPTADTKESQEICFVTDNINSFLERNIGKLPGEIVDVSGKRLGKHKGLFYYTIGQRKGINLPGGPYYVLEKKKKDNLLVITKEKKDLFKKELNFKNGNFFKKPIFPFQAKVKIRYGGKGEEALVEKGKVVFSSPQEAVTSGQSVVFYKGEELIGGGIIL